MYHKTAAAKRDVRYLPTYQNLEIIFLIEIIVLLVKLLPSYLPICVEAFLNY